MSKTDYRTAYEFLLRIYRDNAFFHIVMKENSNKRVKKIVSGVLEKHYELKYITDVLTDGKVKNNVRPLILIALYSQKFLLTPHNKVITEVNETLDSLGKGALKSFISAVLKKAERGEYTLPAKSDKRYVEVKYNLPSWLVGMYRKDYPDRYEDIISAKEYPYNHIRLNKGTDEKEIYEADKGAKKTEYGFFVKNTKNIELLSCMGKITYMSYGSAMIASILEAGNGKKILDCCAAPGGKAVAMAQAGADITASDIHDHRVELIRSYAERMRANIKICKQDATVFVEKWENYFDAVLADVPCSGMGVIGKKRDIIFNRTYEDIKQITILQYSILENVCRYVKNGGILVYSTCTVFKIENSDIVNRFLENHKDFHKEEMKIPFKNDGEIQLLPDGKGLEGFYICRMRKD